MYPAPSRKTKKLMIIAIASALVIGLLVAVHLRQTFDGVPEQTASRPEAAVSSAAPAPARAPVRFAGAAAENKPEAPPAAPIVDEVTIEKTEVCSGEENLVSVKAHSPDGQNAHLHYNIGSGIGGGAGPRVPVRVWARPDGTFDLPKVSVFGRKNVVTTVDIPAYRVKNCDSLRHVAIFTRLLPNSTDEYELEARIEDTSAGSQSDHQPFRATRYEWTFGDGKSAQTDNPRVEHQFTGPQKSWYTSYLVAVEAVDSTGERVRGRHSLQVMNTTFENFDQRGIVTIVATPTPRFPVLDNDGMVRQRFRLRHHAKGTIRISRVMATYQHSAPKVGPRVDDWTVPTGELALQAVPEGDGTEVSVSLNTLKDADLFSITYLLEGMSEEGYPARGSFSVMRPPPKPTKENSEPITDAVLLAKVKLARKLLGQPFVTDEDLFRLEREGKFADLKVEQAPKSSAPPSEPGKSEAAYRQQ